MDPDHGEEPVSTEYKSILLDSKTAQPGDFTKTVESSFFRGSTLLKSAAPFIEEGRFRDGVSELQAGLQKRGIKLDFTKDENIQVGTQIRDNGQEVMVFDKGYLRADPVEQLWSLVHRYMSLMLRKDGYRDDPKFLQELFKMDVAYAQAVRLGAQRLPTQAERDVALKEADKIEYFARDKIKKMEKLSV